MEKKYPYLSIEATSNERINFILTGSLSREEFFKDSYDSPINTLNKLYSLLVKGQSTEPDYPPPLV